MADLNPGNGNAETLRRYWTAGPGLAKWAGSPHPYGTLLAELEKYMNHNEAAGTAANYFHDVFGIYPGQRPRSK